MRRVTSILSERKVWRIINRIVESRQKVMSTLVNTGIVENKRTPDSEDKDVLILQQSYPDITFTPKIKVEL